MNDGLF